MDALKKFPKDLILPHTLSGLPESTPILVGFSGGADSTALLFMLCEYGKRFGANIYAAHINHCIRGAEADRDEDFCKELCNKLGIEFFTLRADVPSIAKNRGESIETAARNVRYEFFGKIMKEQDIPLLATAHNANDNLETMLFNLSRGSSLSGMCGIPLTRPCDGGTVIRPILGMTKEEIYTFCEEHSLSYVTDSTNTDTDYTRNKIRANIIPLLCEINEGAVKNSARLAHALRADELCLESMKDMFYEGLCDENSVETEKINGSPEAISSRVLVSLYKNVSGNTLEYTHIEALRELSRKNVPHSSVTLPLGIEAVIENGRIVFQKKLPKKNYEPYSIALVEGNNVISQTNCEIIIEYSQNTKNIYKNSILTTIDFDKIVGRLYVRERRAGDKLLVGGMHKSVKKLMCDKKIPLSLRMRLPVICDDNGIAAIPLLSVRDGLRVNDKTVNKCFVHLYIN